MPFRPPGAIRVPRPRCPASGGPADPRKARRNAAIRISWRWSILERRNGWPDSVDLDPWIVLAGPAGPGGNAMPSEKNESDAGDMPSVAREAPANGAASAGARQAED